MIGEQFANRYRGGVDGVEDEAEEETDDSLEMQAGRGGGGRSKAVRGVNRHYQKS